VFDTSNKAKTVGFFFFFVFCFVCLLSVRLDYIRKLIELILVGEKKYFCVITRKFRVNSRNFHVKTRNFRELTQKFRVITRFFFSPTKMSSMGFRINLLDTSILILFVTLLLFVALFET
jgi:hypothetical protein